MTKIVELESIIDLVFCNEEGISFLLNEVSDSVLVKVLRTAPDEVTEKLLKNCAAERKESILTVVRNGPPLKMSEINKAEKEILIFANKLVQEKKLWVKH